MIFTSGTAGEPKAVVHGQRYLVGQRCRPSTGSAHAPASSCGARPPAAGASRRATSSSRRGCAARRRCCTTSASTPTSASRSSTRERVGVLCMAPTEYRVIARRAQPRPMPTLRGRRGGRGARPRGRSRVPSTRPACGFATATARPRPGRRPRSRSAASRCPGRWARRCRAFASGSTTASCAWTRPTAPTFFLGYLGDGRRRAARGRHRRPRDARTTTGYLLLRGPRRRRDHLRRLPHRALRGRVGAGRASGRGRRRGRRRPRRGARRRSCARSSCCATATRPSDALARELQEHVKAADRAVQVPADRRLRRRAAEDGERQDAPRGAACSSRPSRAGSARRRRRRWRR